MNTQKYEEISKTNRIILSRFGLCLKSDPADLFKITPFRIFSTTCKACIGIIKRGRYSEGPLFEGQMKHKHTEQKQGCDRKKKGSKTLRPRLGD